jgi:Family of unknown function (DUF6236)
MHDTFCLVSDVTTGYGARLRYAVSAEDAILFQWLEEEGHFVDWNGGGLLDPGQFANEMMEVLRRTPSGGIISEPEEFDRSSLAIAARYVTETNTGGKLRVVPETDRSSVFAAILEPHGIEERRRCRELLLDGVIPTPGEEVPFADIVDFRSRYRDELLEFRSLIDSMLEGVRQGPDPLDSIYSARQEIELSIRRIERAARSRRLRLTSVAATAVALGSTAFSAVSAETVHWVFDGFGVAASAALGSRLVRGPADDKGSYGYLVRANKAYRKS